MKIYVIIFKHKRNNIQEKLIPQTKKHDIVLESLS